MSVWSGLKNIIDTMNRGAHQEDWNKVAAQEEAIKSEQQKRLLASNSDARAAAGESREADEFGFNKQRRGSILEGDALGLEGKRLGNERDRFTVTNQGADRDRQIKNEEAASKRADRGLDLEGGRLSVAKQEALRMAGLTDAQINAMSARQSEEDATRVGRIDAENYNNSESGRTERSMGRWGAVLRDMEEGPDKQAIIAFLMKQQGIAPEPEKPGWIRSLLTKKGPAGPSPFGENFVGRVR